MKTSIKWMMNLSCCFSLVACAYEEKFPDITPPGQSSPPLATPGIECDSPNKDLIVRDLVWVEGYDEFMENNSVFITTPPDAGRFSSCANMLITVQPDSNSLAYVVSPNFPAAAFFYYVNGMTGGIRVLANNPGNQWAGKRANLWIKSL